MISSSFHVVYLQLLHNIQVIKLGIYDILIISTSLLKFCLFKFFFNYKHSSNLHCTDVILNFFLHLYYSVKGHGYYF